MYLLCPRVSARCECEHYSRIPEQDDSKVTFFREQHYKRCRKAEEHVTIQQQAEKDASKLFRKAYLYDYWVPKYFVCTAD